MGTIPKIAVEGILTFSVVEMLSKPCISCSGKWWYTSRPDESTLRKTYEYFVALFSMCILETSLETKPSCYSLASSSFSYSSNTRQTQTLPSSSRYQRVHQPQHFSCLASVPDVSLRSLALPNVKSNLNNHSDGWLEFLSRLYCLVDCKDIQEYIDIVSVNVIRAFTTIPSRAAAVGFAEWPIANHFHIIRRHMSIALVIWLSGSICAY